MSEQRQVVIEAVRQLLATSSGLRAQLGSVSAWRRRRIQRRLDRLSGELLASVDHLLDVNTNPLSDATRAEIKDALQQHLLNKQQTTEK